MDAIRIFVGCSANGEDAEAQGMLEYTLRKYCTRPLDIVWMKLTRDPNSPWYSNPEKHEGWNTRGWATPFSAFRWSIPYVCDFDGRAIYMDVDQIARADIGGLWDQEIPDGKALLAKNEKTFCVMLMDCERMKKVVPSSYEVFRRTELMYRNVRESAGRNTAKFEGNWNCLDGENYKTLMDSDIKVIHFTKVETQPHFKFALPRLRVEGKHHWNRLAQFIRHARPDVEPLVDKVWREAQEASFTVAKYNTDLVPFGHYDAVRGGARAA
jgi:hypothetical protein